MGSATNGLARKWSQISGRKLGTAINLRAGKPGVFATIKVFRATGKDFGSG